MLSFDISDRTIRVISGVEKNGKIKISSSATIPLEEGLIENGQIRDLMSVASKIGGSLKVNKMHDKVAVVSISSNSIVFKEMSVPKAKGAQFKTMVQNQLIQSINVMEEQCVSYIVIGDDAPVAGKEKTTKVLATSCPRSIVENYRKVFALIGITLKDVSVNFNSINKLIMADFSLKTMMPFLLVQIDPTFININIYEKGVLTFSRFATISPDNYDDREDYVFQAVNENVFRVLQFQRLRSTEVVGNVLFYGDTSLFIRLTNEMEKLGVKASLLRVNNTISGYERLEFSLFATAIGALYKNNKETDSTNLLQVDVGTTKQVDVSTSSLAVRMVLVFLLSAGLVVGGFFGIKYINDKVQSDIDDVNSYINSKKVKDDLSKYSELEASINSLTIKKNNSANVIEILDKYPVITSQIYKDVDSCFTGAHVLLESEYENGLLKLHFFVLDQKIPHTTVEKIYKNQKGVVGYSYAGYVLNEKAGGYEFVIGLLLNGGDQEVDDSTELKPFESEGGVQ